MIPKHYGGIDRIYGDISIEGADKILDLIDEYVELVEMNKNSTRYHSNQQEKRIAKKMGGKQVIGSGATPFLKGDVIAGKLFIEAKTRAQPATQITVKKEWLEKAKEQSYSTHKPDYALAISFGEAKDYYVVEDSFFEDLYKAREALRAVYDTVLEYNRTSPEDREYLLSTLDIEQMIEEVYQ